MAFGGSPDGGGSLLSLLAAVVFAAMTEWASQQWMAPEHVSPCHQLTGNVCGEIRDLVVEERGESIEIGECVERPLDFYGSGHGRKLDVPHVRSHWTTRSCGTRESGVALAARRSSSAIEPMAAE